MLALLFPLAYAAFLLAETLRPARRLPRVRLWWLKGLGFFALSGLINALVPKLAAPLFAHHLLDLSSLGVAGAVPAFLVVNVVIYWLHRLRHLDPLWRFHLVHHAAERFDVSGSMVFHPFETALVSVVIPLSSVALFGISESAAAALAFAGFSLTFFQHANIRTPAWLGYLVQRPEQHSVHHARGVHAFNYATLPVLDMMFGTYRNPAGFEAQQGLEEGSSRDCKPGALGLVLSLALVPACVLAAPSSSAPEQSLVLPAAAAHLDVAQAYAAHWHAQTSPLAGPTSLANIMRSLGDVDETEAKLLAGTGKCVRETWCFGGLTLDEVAEIARTKSGKKVTLLRDLTLDQFRAQVQQANDPARRMSVNFSRKEVYGEGAGHHSPIGGYLAATDAVLLLDVTAGKGPSLVPVAKLFAGIDTVDSTSGKKRGLLILE